MRINKGKFTSDKQREKLEVFRDVLKTANDNIELTDEQVWKFLKSFHLFIYDLDINGVAISLLHSLIEQYSRNNANSIWAQIYEHIQWCSERAGYVSLENIPDEIKDAFKKVKSAIPDDYVKDVSKIEIIEWNLYKNADKLAVACLVGSWDENLESDRSILSKIAKLDYEEWILNLRDVLQYPESPLKYNNGIWSVVDRIKLWQSLKNRIFDDHLEMLIKCTAQVLSDIDEKFELEKEERFFARIHGKRLKYSINIRKGLAECLALLGTYGKELTHCTDNKPATTVILTLREIFKENNWKVWAGLNDLLPTLAEAAPDEFLTILEKKLIEDKSLFETIYKQEDTGIGGWNYITGLLWALERLAWDEVYIVRVTVILGELAMIDPGGNWANRPSNSLTTIFLPWMRQTTANFEKRKTAIHTLDNEFPDIAWKLLLSLLPHINQTSMGSQKPVWRNILPEDWNDKVSNKEYWEQISYYSEYLVEKAKDDISKLGQIINNLDNLPKEAFDKLLQYLSSDSILSMPEEEKLHLWTPLIKFTSKHKKHQDAKWSLDQSILNKIDTVAEKIKPDSPANLYAHLFTDREFELYEKKGDWDVQRKKLEDQRKEALKIIHNEKDLIAVINFLDMVDSPRKVGYTFGTIGNNKTDAEILPYYLNSKKQSISNFIGSYIRTRNNLIGTAWVDNFRVEKWSKKQIATFLSYLPFTIFTWNAAEKFLADSESMYWKLTPVNPYDTSGDLTPAIEKLIEYGRPSAAIDCIFRTIDDKKPTDSKLIVKALLSAVTSKETQYSMDVYNITETIKFLQNDNTVSSDDLSNIEWIYLRLLDGYHGEVTPKHLNKKLGLDYNFFCEVIRKIYRSKKVTEEISESTESEEKIATQAWHLLYQWKVPPGLQEDGHFNEVHFREWLEGTIESCEESGHLEVALTQIGKVLFYVPEDQSGFWINKTVASTLNQIDADDMRDGYYTEVFNSRGVHWVDPTGKPELESAKVYRKKAEETENAGYHRFANILRKIAQSYEHEAKRIQDVHQREIDEDNGK